MAVGAVFVVSVLGFSPGVTTDYDSLHLTWHASGDVLLGGFAVGCGSSGVM
jgi:Domain of unknown function (DUF4383)